MQRILITGFFGLPAPGRAGVQMRHVLRTLAPLHEVDVLVVRENEQAYVERQGSARILRVSMPEGDERARIEGFRRALRRQLEGADYDIIHFRDGWSGLPVLHMRKQLGHTAVFDITRSPMAEAPLHDLALGAELARSEEACLMDADHVLVPSEAARNHVLGQRIQGVHHAPPGVDVDLFDWEDLPAGPPAVLYTGTIAAGRGIELLLQAMTEVVTSIDARLLLVGRVAPAYERTLQGTIAALDLHEQVQLAGEVPHEVLPSVIARASVCVAPAAAELDAQPMALYPTKMLEYMACRRAVVAPRRATTSTLLENGTHGLLFSPGDADDLAHKLLCVLQDPALRESLAEAGYQLVRQRYTASATRRALRQAYASMGAAQGSPASSGRADSSAPAARGGQEGESTDQVLPLFAQRTMKLQLRPDMQARGRTEDTPGAAADMPAADAEPGTVITPRPAGAEITPVEGAALPPGDPETDEHPTLLPPEERGEERDEAQEDEPPEPPPLWRPAGPRQHDEVIFWSRFEPVVQDSDGVPLDDPRLAADEGTPVEGVPVAESAAPALPRPDDETDE